MILVTTEGICGKELETLGLVKGSTICLRASHYASFTGDRVLHGKYDPIKWW